MAVVGDAWVRVRVFSAGLSGDISDNVRRQLRGADRDIDREGERTGRRIGDSVSRGVRNNSRGSNGIGSAALKMAKDFGDSFNLGIGRARMGRGIISLLVAATPSVAAAGASMATALASEIVTVLSAIGPGLIGLGAAVGAGLATAALNFGLLYAAFKSGADGLKELKEESTALLEELGKPVAEGMLGGLRDAVSTLRGALPEINDLLRTTGEKWGEIARGAAQTLTSTENMSRLKSILSTNNDFLDRFKNGFNDLITAFLILLDAAKPFVNYLGEGLEKFGAWAKSILEAKEGSGELAESAQRLLDRWKLLWQTIKDFAAGIGNIFSAIAPLGEVLAKSMGETAANFRAWTSDEGNQSKVLAFFTKAHELSSKIFEMLGKLFSVGGNSFLTADFTNLYAVMDSIATKLGPAIAEIFNQIQEAMGPHLVAVVDNLGTAFGKIADNEVIGRAAGLIGTLLEKLSELAATDIGSWVLGIAASWALFGGILTPIVGLVQTLVGAFSPLAAAIAAVIGFIVLMWQNSQSLRDAIAGLVADLLPRFQAIWEKIAPTLAGIWEEVQKLAGALGDRLAPIITALAPVIGDVFTFIGDALSGVLDIAKNVIGFFADVFSGDWEGAWEHVKAIFSGVWNTIISLLGDIGSIIADIFRGWLDLFLGIVSSIWDQIKETVVALGQGLYQAIYDFGNWIKVLWDELWTWVWERLSAAWNGFVSFLSGIWSDMQADFAEFISQAQETWQGLIDWWNNLWAWVKEIAVGAWEGIKSALSAVWNGIIDLVHFLFDPWVNFFSQLWSVIWDGITSAWNAITGWLSTTWNNITSEASRQWENFKRETSSMWNQIVDGIRGVVETIVGWLGERWEDIKGAASGAWDALVGIAEGAWSLVKDAIVTPIEDAYNLVAGWIEDIKSVVTGALEWLGDRVTEANEKLTSILDKQAEATVAGTAIGGGAGMGTTTYLAEGGIVPAIPGGWNVVIGEGGRSERVEPLDSSGLSRRDRAMISKIVGEMTTSTSGGDTIVKVMLDGRELSGIIQNVVTNSNRALAKDANRRRRVFA